MRDESLDLKRRDFIKIGLAAGLVVGIPTGFIPGPGTAKSFGRRYSHLHESRQLLQKIIDKY